MKWKERQERRKKHLLETIERLRKEKPCFHIVCGNVERSEKGTALFTGVEFAHSIDAPGDVMNVYDSLLEAVIGDLEGYIE